MKKNTDRKSAPLCPFCGTELKKPVEVIISAMEKAEGGTCECGAVFLVDTTGKNVGTVMVQALSRVADAVAKDISDLAPGQDYEDAILNYDWRTHRSTGVSTGFMDGFGRIYIVKPKKQKS